MAVERDSKQSNYSQDVPRKVPGLHLAVYFGIKKAAQLLLGSNSPELKDSCGQTPLSCAAANRHEAVVKLLPEKGADLEAKDSHG
jgi:ankyrin repeat protein